MRCDRQEDNNGNERSHELITGPRVEDGLSETRMYLGPIPDFFGCVETAYKTGTLFGFPEQERTSSTVMARS
jgi:hypothetical protein